MRDDEAFEAMRLGIAAVRELVKTAILAERERCAALVARAVQQHGTAAASWLAAAIRKGE